LSNWTQLQSGDRINSDKFKNVLSELDTALNERLAIFGKPQVSFPQLTGNTITDTLDTYATSLRSGITELVEDSFKSGTTWRNWGFVKSVDTQSPDIIEFVNIDDLLSMISTPGEWIDTGRINDKEIWAQFQDAFDKLIYMAFQLRWDIFNEIENSLKATDTFSTAQGAWDDLVSISATETNSFDILGWQISESSVTLQWRAYARLDWQREIESTSMSHIDGAYLAHWLGWEPGIGNSDNATSEPEFEDQYLNVWAASYNGYVAGDSTIDFTQNYQYDAHLKSNIPSNIPFDPVYDKDDGVNRQYSRPRTTSSSGYPLRIFTQLQVPGHLTYG